MRIIVVILGVVAGYTVGTMLGFAAIALLSSNTHDRSVEAAMTSAFVTGPIVAVIGLLIALRLTRANVKK